MSDNQETKKKNRFKRGSHSLKAELFFSTSLIFSAFLIALVVLTYYLFRTTIVSSYTEQMVSASEQSVRTYTNYFKDVINISSSIQENAENQDAKSNPQPEKDYFDDVLTISKDVRSLTLFDSEGNAIVTSTRVPFEEVSPATIRSQTWFTSALSEPLINSFSPLAEDGSEEGAYFILSKVIPFNQGEYSLVLRIVYDFSSLQEVISMTRLGEGGRITIYDSSYRTIYTTATTISDAEMEVRKKQVIGGTTFYEDHRQYYAYFATIPDTRWRVSVVTNADALSSALRTLMIMILSLGLVSLALFLFLTYIIADQITKPIVALQKEMEKVESLNFPVPSETNVTGTKEIISLHRSYQKMMKKIHDLALQVLEEEKEEAKAELAALQNQINPHFLYNTLDSILYLIDEKKDEQAEKMIIALSRFFRLSISKGKNIIPLANELDHCKYYLTIQKMRFGDSFSYTVENHVKGNYYVLKLILQPIVENSLVHGFGEHPERDAKIHVEANEDNEHLIFVLEDNGFGILPEKVKEIQDRLIDLKESPHLGVGMLNVARRIRLYYGESGKVTLESTMDVGTKVTITLPKKGCLHEENN